MQEGDSIFWTYLINLLSKDHREKVPSSIDGPYRVEIYLGWESSEFFVTQTDAGMSMVIHGIVQQR